MPSKSGKGYADYVLWGDDRKPLAVIEAKRTSVDADKGKQQAKIYADRLEEEHGQRPVIFYTNGYITNLWDDTAYPPRAVQGFYKKDDLVRLINRRSIPKDTLKNQDINTDITNRPYQTECIRRITEHLEDRFRKALAVMATGTGKTRTAISLTDILQRAGWAKRILFLAATAAGPSSKSCTGIATDFACGKSDLKSIASLGLSPKRSNRPDRPTFSGEPSSSRH